MEGCSDYRRPILMVAVIFLCGVVVCPASAQTELKDRSLSLPPTEIQSGESESSPEDKTPELVLALAKLRLDDETGDIDGAFTLVEQLLEKYPNDVELLTAQARLNFRIGNKSETYADLDHAAAIAPENLEIINQERDEMLAQGPNSSVGYNFRRTTQADEHQANVTASVRLDATSTAALQIENDYLTTKQDITHPNGAIQGFAGDRQRASLTFDKSFANSTEVLGALYGAEDILGGGGEFRVWDHYGDTSLQGNIYRPYWDYIESIVERGTKSNIRVERKQFISNNLQADLGGGFNHYELQGDSNAADSGSWDLNVVYTHPFELSKNTDDDLTFGAQYAADAEYFTHVDHRLNSNGLKFSPLPARDYEVHSGTLSLGKKLLSNVEGEIFGGYAANRLDNGNYGPLYGLLINYTILSNASIGVHATHTRLGGENNSQSEDNIGLTGKWLW